MPNCPHNDSTGSIDTDWNSPALPHFFTCDNCDETTAIAIICESCHGNRSVKTDGFTDLFGRPRETITCPDCSGFGTQTVSVV